MIATADANRCLIWPHLVPVYPFRERAGLLALIDAVDGRRLGFH